MALLTADALELPFPASQKPTPLRTTAICSLLAAIAGLGLLLAFRRFLQCLAAEDHNAALAFVAVLCLLFVLRERFERITSQQIHKRRSQTRDDLLAQCDRRRQSVNPATAASRWSRQKEEDVVILAEAAAYPLKTASALAKAGMLVIAAWICDWRIGLPATLPALGATIFIAFTGKHFRWLSINNMMAATNLLLLLYACWYMELAELPYWVLILLVTYQLQEPLQTIVALQIRRPKIKESHERIARFLND